MNCRGNAIDQITEVSEPHLLPKKPVVSVYMLAYNHGPYLAEAIEGVISQKTEFATELVIGEDCSTDNTRQIALKYQQRYPGLIRVIYSASNVGMIANGRRVFNACRGEFIAFCEGDDYWQNPEKLQMQVAYLRGHTECVLVHTDWDHLIFRFGKWRIRKNATSKIKQLIENGRVYEAYQQHRLFIMTCTVLMRRSVNLGYYQSGLDYSHYLIGDRPKFAYAASQGEIFKIVDSTATYRSAQGSVMNSGAAANVERARNRLKIYREFDELVGPVNTGGWNYRVFVGRRLCASAIWARDRQALDEGIALLNSEGHDLRRSITLCLDRLTIDVGLLFFLRRSYRQFRSLITEYRHYKKL